jgi:hypothetical protein
LLLPHSTTVVSNEGAQRSSTISSSLLERGEIEQSTDISRVNSVMGNEMSQEEEEALFMEEALKMSAVDDVHLDQKLNDGTTAPNCQPRHTIRAAQCTEVRSYSMAESRGEQGVPPRRSQSENFDSRKRMGYIQMARAGYQELVNAIIRPPRAEYKVCFVLLQGIIWLRLCNCACITNEVLCIF